MESKQGSVYQAEDCPIPMSPTGLGLEHVEAFHVSLRLHSCQSLLSLALGTVPGHCCSELRVRAPDLSPLHKWQIEKKSGLLERALDQETEDEN